MEKYKPYSFLNIYEESGFSESFTIPNDCEKAIGLYLLPQFQRAINVPDGVSFCVGKVSVLFNNKNDNSVHDYPIMCHPDVNGKMSVGDLYAYDNNKIDLKTKIERGNVLTIIFKDSGYMASHIEAHPELYSTYNPGLDVYLIYEDSKGDWSNREFDMKLNALIKK